MNREHRYGITQLRKDFPTDASCLENDAGHDYELHNMEDGVQNLKFIKKEKDEETGEFKTVQNGTTNEAVLEVLIHRMKLLNEKMHSPFNDEAIAHLKEALKALNARTAEREDRGVDGWKEIVLPTEF